MQTMTNNIRAATLAARERTGDSAISSCVKAGKFQINRVTFPNGARSVVVPLTEYLPIDEAIRYLESL